MLARRFFGRDDRLLCRFGSLPLQTDQPNAAMLSLAPHVIARSLDAVGGHGKALWPLSI
jgi:hypothetical protein